MLKETETKETIVFFVTILSLVAFQLGGGPWPPYGYAYEAGVRIVFFLFARWHASKLFLFQMLEVNGLLAKNKARTEVLPFAISRARPIYWSVEIYRLTSRPSLYIVLAIY